MVSMQLIPSAHGSSPIQSWNNYGILEVLSSMGWTTFDLPAMCKLSQPHSEKTVRFFEIQVHFSGIIPRIDINFTFGGFSSSHCQFTVRKVRRIVQHWSFRPPHESLMHVLLSISHATLFNLREMMETEAFEIRIPYSGSYTRNDEISDVS